REKKRPIKLKLRVELIVFRYLRVGYFPDTFLFSIKKYFSLLKNLLFLGNKAFSYYQISVHPDINLWSIWTNNQMS
ncbi:hypothetical protein EFP68_08040, partial [Lactobacillus helveticus]|uniref:hypothetical protein n=1 Tax=Lactobacillus helveticus TaxID=1587 RepID=UPI0021A58241